VTLLLKSKTILYNSLWKGSARTEGPRGLNPVALVGYSLGQGATMQDTSVKKKSFFIQENAQDQPQK
jgi:hypothetical protein